MWMLPALARSARSSISVSHSSMSAWDLASTCSRNFSEPISARFFCDARNSSEP